MKETKESRDVKNRVLRMKSKGQTAREIAEALNADGVTTPAGKKFTSQKIFDIVYADKKKSGYVKQAKALLNPKPVEEDLEEIATDVNFMGILFSARYSDTQKVNALKALIA